MKKKQITKLSFHRNLPTTTEEGGIPGVALEMCGVRRELGVLREVLLEVTRLGPGAGVLRKPPGVCALLELLKMEEYTHLQYLAFRDPSLCTENYGVYVYMQNFVFSNGLLAGIFLCDQIIR